MGRITSNIIGIGRLAHATVILAQFHCVNLPYFRVASFYIKSYTVNI